MLSEIDENVIAVHGTVALGLLAAEHVAPLFAARPTTRALIEDALRADWSWLETRVPDPSKLYGDYMAQFMEEDTLLRDDARLPVLHCALYAHTYAIWSAEGVTYLEQPGTVLSIGNDIAEVDESYLTQCLEHAVKVSPQPEQTTTWLNGLIAYMGRNQRITPANVIGAPLRRSDFTVPAIHA